MSMLSHGGRAHTKEYNTVKKTRETLWVLCRSPRETKQNKQHAGQWAEGSSVKYIFLKTYTCTQMYVHRTSGLRSPSGELGDQGGPRGGKGSHVWHFEFVLGITQEEKEREGERRCFGPWSLCKPPRQNGSSPRKQPLKTTLLSALLLNWVPIS